MDQRNVLDIKILERQLQKLHFILPSSLSLREILRVGGSRWRIGNLGDQVSGRSLGDAVDKDAQEGNLQEQVEADSEAEE